jgi:hypothetical protein
MGFSAIANYRGGLAHYKVVPEEEGFYHAYLRRWDGRSDQLPPSMLILVKGAEGWSGSAEEPGLLRQLGEVIDRRTNGRLYHLLQPGLGNQRKNKT